MPIFQALGRRSLHTLPRLSASNAAGALQLFSETGFDTAWKQSQQFALDKLNACIVDTENETRAPFHIMLNAQSKPELAHVFNFASLAYSNHLFFSSLGPKKTEPTGLLQRRINASFKSLEGLKASFLEAALSLEGQGSVFLVETPEKTLEVIACNNTGSASSYYRRDSIDLNGGGSEDSVISLNNLKNKVNAREQCFNIDLLALNVWQRAYFTDYKFDKQQYVEKWFDLIDWNQVDSRLFKGRMN